MALKDYVVRRTFIAVPTLFAISVIVFTIIHAAPGDPFQFFLGFNPRVSMETIEFLREKYHLNDPIWVQYISWLKMLLSGDMGYSFITHRAVSDAIMIRVPNTVKLVLTAELIAILLAIPLGTISAVKEGGIVDNISRVISLLGVSMPSFWLGILLILLFAVRLNLLPTCGSHTTGMVYSSTWESIKDQIYHLILPAMTLGYLRTAYLTRLLRSSLLEVLSKDYIMTARMKGLKERVVIYKHALRNALLPFVTAIGLAFGFLLSGAVLIETVFAWPGMGRLIVDATFTRDYPVIMGTTMMTAVMVVVANLITDIVYAFLDPRITYD